MNRFLDNGRSFHLYTVLSVYTGSSKYSSSLFYTHLVGGEGSIKRLSRGLPKSYPHIVWQQEVRKKELKKNICKAEWQIQKICHYFNDSNNTGNHIKTNGFKTVNTIMENCTGLKGLTCKKINKHIRDFCSLTR